MRVLVTGGSGFLGSHMVRECIDRKHLVINYDLNPPNEDIPGAKWVKGDMLDAETLAKYVGESDIVLHFAAMAGIQDCIDRPVAAFHANVCGVITLLEILKTSRKPILFASSVYTEGTAGSIYRITKSTAEELITDYGDRFGIPHTILRYGTLYGKNSDADNSISRYIRQAYADKLIIAGGTGDEIREYIDARDAARITVDLMDNETTNMTFLISGPVRYKLRDVLELISEILPFQVGVQYAKGSSPARYVSTPCRVIERQVHKICSAVYYDLGSGIKNIISDLKNRSEI